MASMDELIRRTVSLADAWGELAADLDSKSEEAEKAGNKELADAAAECSAGIDQVADAIEEAEKEASQIREGHPEVF